MNKVKFPEIIDKYYDDAFNAQYEREDFKRLYNEQNAEGAESVKRLLEFGNAFYQDDLDEVLSNVQGTSERLGFLVGFRYAVKMMQEVYA